MSLDLRDRIIDFSGEELLSRLGLREDKDPRGVVKEHAGESDGIASNPDVR